MGIRVHKVIGYGIDDLQHDGRKMTDPRINWKRLNMKLEKAYDVDADKFLKWCVSSKKKLMEAAASETRMDGVSWKNLPWLLEMGLKEEIKSKRHWDLGSHVIHDEEYGMPNVMLFIPVGSNWKRYDDTIDWVEETACYKQENRIVRLENDCKSGIYPYNGFMVRFRDPEPGIMDDLGDIPKKLAGCLEPGESRSDGKGFTFLSARLYGFLIERKCSPRRLREHLVNDWRPMLPEELIPVLFWFKDCFTDLRTFADSLRPLLYVYWS